MDYRTLLQEENDAVRERYQLSMERIKAMGTEEMRQPYGSYFKKTAAFILQVGEVVRRRWEEGGAGHADMDLKGLRRENHALYEDILPENYGRAMPIPTMRSAGFQMEWDSCCHFSTRKYAPTSCMPLRCGWPI